MARPGRVFVLHVIGHPMVQLIIEVLEASPAVPWLHRCLARVPRASRHRAIWRRRNTLRNTFCLHLNGLSCCLNGPVVLSTWSLGNLLDHLRLSSRNGLNWRHRCSRRHCCRKASAEVAEVLKGLLRRWLDKRPCCRCWHGRWGPEEQRCLIALWYLRCLFRLRFL